MPKTKKRASQAAAKVLSQVIAEETAAIRGELDAANKRIVELQGVLAAIATAAMTAHGQVVVGAPQEKRLLPAALAAAAATAEEPIWHEPPIDLAGEDDMGPGRFV